MGRLFGTDGVRGLANRDITAELALDLSVAAAHVLADSGEFAGHRPGPSSAPTVGRRGVPRRGGGRRPGLGRSRRLQRGRLAHTGGCLPHRRHRRRPRRHALGFAQPDAGQRDQVLRARRSKLADEVEDAIERRMGEDWDRPTGAAVGRVKRLADGTERYIAHLLGVLPHRLDGLRIVIDAAHGAASEVAPSSSAGPAPRWRSSAPTPTGSISTTATGRPTWRTSVSLWWTAGPTSDRQRRRRGPVPGGRRGGEVVDGDQIMAILALAMRERGELVESTLVATVMSNLGLMLAMEKHGVAVRQTAVGDRYVLEELREGGFSLGGEQSGHVILPAHGTTGDGLLTGLLPRRSGGAHRPNPGRARRRDDPAPAGPRQRPRRRQGRRRRPSRGPVCRGGGHGRPSGRPGECCCASPGRSLWSE